MQNLTKDVAERQAEATLLSNELMHLHGIATTYRSIVEKMATAPVDSVEDQHHLDLCKVRQLWHCFFNEIFYVLHMSVRATHTHTHTLTASRSVGLP